MHIITLITSIFFLFFNSFSYAETQSKNSKVKIKIDSSYKNKKDNLVVLKTSFKIQNGWYIYAPTDNSFVQPPDFSLRSLQNATSNNKKIIWPKSKKINEKITEEESISYNIYKDNVDIFIEFNAIKNNQLITGDLIINYSLCNDVCIYESQKFRIKIPPFKIDKKLLNTIKNSPDNNKSSHLLVIMLIAFLGGVILNIMPCVLPVLSIKILGIIKYRKYSTMEMRFSYIATIIGIISSFFILGIITFVLKTIGAQVGWGTHFQNPYFLIFLVIILTIFTANLMELFHISMGNIDLRYNNKNIFLANFTSGVLVVLLATPCSAPFVGTAISFALSQGIKEIMLIFLSMATGLSLPYFILLIAPKSIDFLPKSGNWMIKIKHLIAGLLIATIIWLLYTLSQNIGFISSLVLGLLLSTIVVLFKSYDNSKSKFKIILISIISTISLILPIKLSEYFIYKKEVNNSIWIEFNQEKIQKYLDQNKVIIIDITADWCITCKVNKILVFNSKDFKNFVREEKIITMRGDITKPNIKISNFMKQYNKYAIPFNIIYGPNNKNGKITPILLTTKKVKNIVEEVRY